MIEKRRRSIRLKQFDYRQPGMYFATIVAHKRRCVFGEVVDGKVQLSQVGRIVNEMWCDVSERFPNVSIDAFIIMPNHIHVVICVEAQSIAPGGAGQKGAMNRAPTLGQIIRTVKAISTYKIRQTTGDLGPLWQRNYYEHVIRDEKSLQRIRQYICDNPLRWELDPENPEATLPESSDPWRVP